MPGGANFELTPTDLIPFNDGTGRLMLATLGGTIRVIDGGGNLLPAPLLTTSQTVTARVGHDGNRLAS